MTTSLADVFARMALHTDGVEYVIVSVPRQRLQVASILFTGLAEALSVMVLDKDEITLVLRAEDWELARASAPEARAASGYRLITFDLPLDLDQVGVLATVSNLLADANVALFAVSAYERDHLLVRREDFERAWSVLSNLIAQYRRLMMH
jgi:hypothetical protein